MFLYIITDIGKMCL